MKFGANTFIWFSPVTVDDIKSVTPVMAEGGFAPSSVADVLGQDFAGVGRHLEALTALSLARPAEMPGRYELHPLLADYSRTLAREAGEWDELCHAHLAHYVAYAEHHTHDYPALEAELPNLIAASLEPSAKISPKPSLLEIFSIRDNMDSAFPQDRSKPSASSLESIPISHSSIAQDMHSDVVKASNPSLLHMSLALRARSRSPLPTLDVKPPRASYSGPSPKRPANIPDLTT